MFSLSAKSSQARTTLDGVYNTVFVSEKFPLFPKADETPKKKGVLTVVCINRASRLALKPLRPCGFSAYH
jgi:hypothetical protein